MTRDDIAIIGSDGALYHAYNDAGGWHWESLGGKLTSAPAIQWHEDGTLAIYARGTDNQLWGINWGPSGWGAWSPLGGILASGPAVSTPVIASTSSVGPAGPTGPAGPKGDKGDPGTNGVVSGAVFTATIQ